MKAVECSKAIESDRKISTDEKNFLNECIVPQNERKVTEKREIIFKWDKNASNSYKTNEN